MLRGIASHFALERGDSESIAFSGSLMVEPITTLPFGEGTPQILSPVSRAHKK